MWFSCSEHCRNSKPQIRMSKKQNTLNCGNEMSKFWKLYQNAAQIIVPLKLTCKFGGRKPTICEKRKCNTKSFRLGCLFEVFIKLLPNGKFLEVMRVI